MFELEETKNMADLQINIWSNDINYRITITGFPVIGEGPLAVGKEPIIQQVINAYSEVFIFYPLEHLFN